MPFCDAPLLLPYCIDSLYANFATGTGACFFIACNLICKCFFAYIRCNFFPNFNSVQPITDKLMEKSTTAMLIYLTRKVECRL
ncbi:hypothetical protein D917_05206 [Trichinella nativa]|uniref:Uncharacterized protein n=1 Tax=Trichinella nativa TaxID=6335 RepID=A0A1Y3EXW6_9BILA|nr:hypothetical protein D917_05206 [Trichinella nativa]